jgi:hypothetical protein
MPQQSSFQSKDNDGKETSEPSTTTRLSAEKRCYDVAIARSDVDIFSFSMWVSVEGKELQVYQPREDIPNVKEGWFVSEKGKVSLAGLPSHLLCDDMLIKLCSPSTMLLTCSPSVPSQSVYQCASGTPLQLRDQDVDFSGTAQKGCISRHEYRGLNRWSPS